MILISPEQLFSSLVEVERKITEADARFARAVLGDRAQHDTRAMFDAIKEAERVFRKQRLPLRRRRSKR